MGDHAVVHFEIGGPDSKALSDFYAKLFGWTINADNPMNYAMVFKMDGGIGGGIMTPPTNEAYVSVYVTCGDDIAGVLQRAVDLGATKIMDVMPPNPPAPALAMFADPDGNIIGLVSGSSSEAPPPGLVGTGAAVTWFEIAAPDGAKIQDFYRKLFDWKIDADNPMSYGMVEAIGNGIGGGITAGDAPRVTVYVAVPDLDAALAKANELGGTTVMEPADVPGGPRIAMFADPAGNTVGLLLPSP